MKINSESSIFKRIILLILVIIVFNAICPPRVEADSWQIKQGGGILKTIFNFLVFVGDFVMDLLQDNFVSPNPILITANSDEAKHFETGTAGMQFLGLLGLAFGLLLIPWTGGLSAWFSMTTLLGVGFAVGGVVTMVSCGHDLHEALGGDFDIPMIEYEPYTIFSGQVPAFDVNFLHPSPDKIIMDKIEKEESDDISFHRKIVDDYIKDTVSLYWGKDINIQEDGTEAEFRVDIIFQCKTDMSDCKIVDWYAELTMGDYTGMLMVETWEVDALPIELELTDLSEETIKKIAKDYANVEVLPNGLIPKGTIISGWENGIGWIQILSYLDCHGEDVEYVKKTYESTAKIMQKALATWYIALRRIAVVVLLSMLLYVGIKIILASASDQKAKYKRFFVDWLMALCMLFVLHYIMIFILTISNGLTKIFITQGNITMTEVLPDDTKLKVGGSLQEISTLKDSAEEVGHDIKATISDQDEYSEIWKNSERSSYMGWRICWLY